MAGNLAKILGVQSIQECTKLSQREKCEILATMMRKKHNLEETKVSVNQDNAFELPKCTFHDKLSIVPELVS